MKRIVLILSLLIIIFSFSVLNAFELKFGEGTEFKGTFKPIIFNVSVFSYYDNGSVFKVDPYILDCIMKIKSQNFNPEEAYIYIKVNDNITKKLEFYFTNANVFPGYIDTYIFAGKITPEDFGYQSSYDNYTEMLNDIDNITFYLEYKGRFYSYSFNNLSEYKDFLKEFNHSILRIDTTNYPIVSWELDPNITLDDLGVCLLNGDDEEDKWNAPYLPANAKVDYDSKAVFGEWYHGENIPTQINFTTIPDILIPGFEKLVLKVKSQIKADINEDSVGNNIYRFQAAFKKIPDNKVIPITNIHGWRLFGIADEEIHSDFFGKIFELDKISTIWTWNGNSWSIWSPDNTIMNVISDYGLKKLFLIYPYSGFWVNFK